MFKGVAAIIAVSRAMERKLASLGAPAEKLYYNPYGIDCTRFGGAQPAAARPIFVAIGRFVEKKAPHLTIRAFASVHRQIPQVRLNMIGDGPLLEDCRLLAAELGVSEAVAFLGPQPSEVVQAELRKARCFVQHSVEAPSGDSEGTPLGILEAGASGLPVVSTRHAGIPDVVVEGETGFLVNEQDVEAMATHMLLLARDPETAARFGESARIRVSDMFSVEKSIASLWKIIESTIVSAEVANAT
jgi:glycosyltransferase involved in cell wall biosynthesis